MEQNQELTFYYVENKCPSQNINGNLALYPISMSWAFGNLNAGWDIWIYLVSRRPQNILLSSYIITLVKINRGISYFT